MPQGIVFLKLKNVFLSSRNLAKVLDYSDYRNFQSVIDKAKEAYKNSGENVQNHFVEFTEMVSIGYGVKRDSCHCDDAVCVLSCCTKLQSV